MTDTPPDDVRLDNAEAQMRRALGLTGNTPARPTSNPSTTTANGSHPSRRHFVRDGEVPVTILRHQHPDTESTNQLDAARQAIRTHAAARERTERLLEQAQATIKDLQTKLGHERLAKDEAIGRANADRRTVEHALETVRVELAGEKIARERAEQALRDARSTISNLTEKLCGAQQALTTVKAELAADRQQARETATKPIATPTTNPPANDDGAAQTDRRLRGRPRKVTVVETVEKPIKTVGKGSWTFKVTRSEKVLKKVAGGPPKPVKWWLARR
jgi:paraquat-inducible protein B